MKFFKKKNNNVVIFTKDDKKYVLIFNSFKPDDIKFILRNVISSSKNDNNDRIKQLFIHTHGINGYMYDLTNYFTRSDFINSISDKDVCIFINNNRHYLIIPFITKMLLFFHEKTFIKRQNKIINLIVRAMIMSSKKNDTSSNNNLINVVLSGFSYGCILNTYILNSLASKRFLGKINDIYLIEEAIPYIKYVLEPFKKRYMRLKRVLLKVKTNILGNITLILIPADSSNKIMSKYHSIGLVYDFMQKINNDIEIQQNIYACQCYVDNKDENSENFKKSLGNNKDTFVKVTTKVSDIGIKYCPQKNNIF